MKKTMTKAEAKRHLAEHEAAYEKCLAELRRIGRRSGHRITKRVRELHVQAADHGAEMRKALDVLIA